MSRFTPYNAVALVEGFEEGTEEQVLDAWQYLVDTGLVWNLQGSLGRQAVALLQEGVLQPPCDKRVKSYDTPKS